MRARGGGYVSSRDVADLAAPPAGPAPGGGVVRIPAPRTERWTVDVTPVGGRWCVRPCKGFSARTYWACTLDPARHTSFWRVVTGVYSRREWPRNERQLAKAVVDCREWCRRHNERDVLLARSAAEVAS